MTYLARQGEPDLGISSLPLPRDDRDLSGQADWLSEHAGRAQVVLKADSYETQHWAVFCGGGLALLPRFLGRHGARAAPDQGDDADPLGGDLPRRAPREPHGATRAHGAGLHYRGVHSRAASLNPAGPADVIATVSDLGGDETRATGAGGARRSSGVAAPPVNCPAPDHMLMRFCTITAQK